MNYTEKTDTFDSNMVVSNSFTFAPSDFRSIKTNSKTIPISELVDYEAVGEQINTTYYITQLETPYKLITIQNMSSIVLDSKSGGEFIFKNIYDKSSKKVQKGDLLISRNASLGKVSYIGESSNLILNGGISLLRINKEQDRFYLMAFFISTYGREYLELQTSSGGTQQNAKREDLLNMETPIPEDKQVKELVSIIVQNIIDKEQQIKTKSTAINKYIHDELEDHSYTVKNHPNSMEITNSNFRFDSGLYSNEYRSIKQSVENYEHGFFKLLDKYNAKRGPNLAISVIGRSIYSDKVKDNFYRLITNVEFTEDRTISTYRYLGNKNDLPLIPKNCIMLSADGSVGRCIYVEDLGESITNYHPWLITPNAENREQYKNIYTAMFLGYLRAVGFYEKIQDKSNGGGIKLPHLQNWISIPEFPKELQQKIANEYHNEVDQNKNLTLATYLAAEKTRNGNLGIWQLNMELFTLRERLEKVISDIVSGDKIDPIKYLN